MIEIEVKDADVRRMFSTIQARLGHLRPAMGLVGKIVLAVHEGAMETGAQASLSTTKEIA